MWKSINVVNYPTKVTQMSLQNDSALTRSITNGKLNESGKSILSQATLINDATKAWNLSSDDVKLSLSYSVAKKIIKTFVKRLPV